MTEGRRLMDQKAEIMKNISLLGAGAVLAIATSHFLPESWSHASAAVTVQVDPAPLERHEGAFGTFAAVVDKAAPSVVAIYTTRSLTETSGRSRFFDEEFFRRFFGEPDEERGQTPRGGEPRRRTQEGLGSGVIVSKDGYIITNNHVVEDADEIRVTIPETRAEYEAKLIGRDPKTDVAVLKIEGKDLPAITLADSDQVRVGDVVLAIGNPLGVGQTVTQGIVSAKGRGFNMLDYEDFIQTDAAINMGNSGGALVDAKGRLLGINTFIISRSGGNQGLGFAVPINLARSIMQQLTNGGEVVRGYLGIFIQDVTPELAEMFKLPAASGALVAGVGEDTPAAKSGFKEGDVVVSYEGKDVLDNRALRVMTSQTAPGTDVTVTVFRDGEKKVLKATIGRLPEQSMAGGSPAPAKPEPVAPIPGVKVDNLTDELREQYDIPKDVEGVVITSIDVDRAPEDLGLREGEVILEWNRSRVTNLKELKSAQESRRDRRTLLRVWSGGGNRFVVIAPKSSR